MTLTDITAERQGTSPMGRPRVSSRVSPRVS